MICLSFTLHSLFQLSSQCFISCSDLIRSRSGIRAVRHGVKTQCESKQVEGYASTNSKLDFSPCKRPGQVVSAIGCALVGIIMDPFQVRMEFLGLLKCLNASQQSIQKIVAFALRYSHKCADNIWDCIMTECAKVCDGKLSLTCRNHPTHALICCLCWMYV